MKLSLYGWRRVLDVVVKRPAHADAVDQEIAEVDVLKDLSKQLRDGEDSRRRLRY